ncbi:MAG TPA: S41 family peptidase [Pyrinomonadaceae bacterium]|nr:S41 family peptidase [Pyrinomonadaceae bacterium]
MKNAAFLIGVFGAIFAFSIAANAQDGIQKTPFWNDPAFWETRALKTPYKADLSENEKIAGISKFWSEAKYNFVNFDLVPGVDWDKEYLVHLEKVRQTRSTLEYFRVLQEFAAKLHDGHTLVLPPTELSELVNSRPMIQTALIEGKVVITHVLDPELTAQGFAPGVEIAAIDRTEVKAFAEEKVAPYVSVSTPQARDYAVYTRWLLAGPIKTPVLLELRDAKGRTFSRSIPRVAFERWRASASDHEPFEMTRLPGNVLLVRLNTFTNPKTADEFEKNFDTIEKADALVLDLRQNGGGSDAVGARILSLLLENSFKSSKWATREYHPAFRAWNKPDQLYTEASEMVPKTATRTYSKPVVLLTSARTGSAAEDFVLAFRTAERGLVIGESTSGSSGQPLVVSLPGGIIAGICTKYDTFPDGTPFIGVGIKPDVQVAPTIKDLLTGSDRAVARALDQIRIQKLK